MKIAILFAAPLLVLLAVSTSHGADKQKKNGESELAGKVLRKFDANGDGRVDQREQAAARNQQRGGAGHGGPAGGPNWQQLFKRIDTNGNGSLEAAEIQAAKTELEKRREAKVQGGKEGPDKAAKAVHDRAAMTFMAMLQKMDANGNGAIEAQEIQAAQAQMQAMLAQAKAAQAQNKNRKPGRGKRK